MRMYHLSVYLYFFAVPIFYLKFEMIKWKRCRLTSCKWPFMATILTCALIIWWNYLDSPWNSLEEAPDSNSQQDIDGSALDTLSDLVSTTEMICLVAEQLGRGANLHTICKETTNSKIGTRNLTIVSLESSDLSFEESLASRSADNSVFVLSSNGSHFSGDLPHNIHLVRPSALEAKDPSLGKRAWVRDMESLLASRSPVHILKFSSMASLPVQAWMVRSLVENRYLDHADQILLVIDIRQAAEFRQWAKAIRELRDRGGFGIFHTQYVGDCTRSRCRYSTSWLKRRPTKVPRPDPRDDLETPDVERLLTTTTAYCRRRLSVPVPSPSDDKRSPLVPDTSPRASNWPVCLDTLQPPCLVYCLRIGGSAVFEETMAILGCRVFVFDPSFRDHNFTWGSKDNIRGFSWGFGNPQDKSVVAGVYGSALTNAWTYLTPLEAIANLGHHGQKIDVLHINIHGGEWAILSAFVNSGVLSRVHQVVAAVHVWYGEETFNLVSRAAQVRQLGSRGLGIFFTEPMVSTSFGTESKMANCCHVVGWIRDDPVPNLQSV